VEQFRVVVTGSRHWNPEDSDIIYRRLRELPRGTRLAHGGAEGADTVAAAYARSLGFEVPPPYRPTQEEMRRFGARGAFLARNRRMLEKEQPHLVLAFRAMGKSNGTDHTVDTARSMEIPTEIIRAC
jgi:hypothetical protein